MKELFSTQLSTKPRFMQEWISQFSYEYDDYVVHIRLNKMPQIKWTISGVLQWLELFMLSYKRTKRVSVNFDISAGQFYLWTPSQLIEPSLVKEIKKYMNAIEAINESSSIHHIRKFLTDYPTEMIENFEIFISPVSYG